MTLTVKFTLHGAEDFDFWARGDKKVLEKIKALLRDAREHPSTGIGKPERLKHELYLARAQTALLGMQICPLFGRSD